MPRCQEGRTFLIPQFLHSAMFRCRMVARTIRTMKTTTGGTKTTSSARYLNRIRSKPSEFHTERGWRSTKKRHPPGGGERSQHTRITDTLAVINCGRALREMQGIYLVLRA